MFIPDPGIKKEHCLSAAVSDISFLLQKPIMIMGADVSHAAPEHKVSFFSILFCMTSVN
jgi:hypothetical protein